MPSRSPVVRRRLALLALATAPATVLLAVPAAAAGSPEPSGSASPSARAAAALRVTATPDRCGITLRGVGLDDGPHTVVVTVTVAATGARVGVQSPAQAGSDEVVHEPRATRTLPSDGVLALRLQASAVPDRGPVVEVAVTLDGTVQPVVELPLPDCAAPASPPASPPAATPPATPEPPAGPATPSPSAPGQATPGAEGGGDPSPGSGSGPGTPTPTTPSTGADRPTPGTGGSPDPSPVGGSPDPSPVGGAPEPSTPSAGSPSTGTPSTETPGTGTPSAETPTAGTPSPSAPSTPVTGAPGTPSPSAGPVRPSPSTGPVVGLRPDSSPTASPRPTGSTAGRPLPSAVPRAAAGESGTAGVQTTSTVPTAAAVPGLVGQGRTGFLALSSLPTPEQSSGPLAADGVPAPVIAGAPEGAAASLVELLPGTTPDDSAPPELPTLARPAELASSAADPVVELAPAAFLLAASVGGWLLSGRRRPARPAAATPSATPSS